MSELAADWLEIVGGKRPYHEAIVTAFTAKPASGGPSIETLVTNLPEATIVVVFCSSGDIEELPSAATPSSYVMAVVPDLDVSAFEQALRAGANGVIWEDSPTAHLVDVARAALNGDILLPSMVVDTLVNGDTSDVDRIGKLDSASAQLLNELVAGRTAQQIASELHFSDRTIQRRITNLCLSLGAKTPVQAVHRAHQSGLLS